MKKSLCACIVSYHTLQDSHVPYTSIANVLHLQRCIHLPESNEYLSSFVELSKALSNLQRAHLQMLVKRDTCSGIVSQCMENIDLSVTSVSDSFQILHKQSDIPNCWQCYSLVSQCELGDSEMVKNTQWTLRWVLLEGRAWLRVWRMV